MKAKKYWNCKQENCKYNNGLVCNICWKQVYESFYERQAKQNGKTDKRATEKAKDS